MNGDQATSSPLVRLVIVAFVVGAVVAMACSAWQRTHDRSEDERELQHGYTVLRQTGTSAKPPPFEREPAPIPARQPVATGTVAAVVVLAIGRVLVFMRRMEAAHTT